MKVGERCDVPTGDVEVKKYVVPKDVLSERQKLPSHVREGSLYELVSGETSISKSHVFQAGADQLIL